MLKFAIVNEQAPPPPTTTGGIAYFQFHPCNELIY